MASTTLASIPKEILLPTIAALGGYANAKLGLSRDLWSLWHQIAIYGIHLKRRETKDRLNIFYVLENLALTPSTAKRTFILIPRDPDTPADQQSEWTYAEAYELVLRYAAWLHTEHGIKKGEVIAMDFGNRPEFVWVWFALWSLGAVPAFINYNLRDQAFAHCVLISRARLLLVEDSFREALTEEVAEKFAAGGDDGETSVEVVVVDDELRRRILRSSPYRAPDAVRSGNVIMSTAMLIYTSGTTGLPKAANVHWGKAYSGIRLFSTECGIQKDDRYITALPLYHSSGSVLGVLMVMNKAATVIVCPRFSPRTFMRYASQNRATGMQYIGEMCRYLVASPPSRYDTAHRIRFAYGNGMRPDVWQKFKDRFHIDTIVEFYGATEGPGTSYIHSRNTFLVGAIGRQGALIRNLLSSIILVRHDYSTDEPYRDPRTGLCVRCAVDEPGEVLNPLDPKDIEAKYVGYFGNEKATMGKVLRDVLKKGDAYYRTGDLQRRDGDGRLWFVDRVGDTFRWKSENVSTAEVSQAIGSHPAVTEANVYGVQIPGYDGRAGCAALVLASGKTLDAALAQDLTDHVRRQLPQYAIPLFLRRMEQVEVTGTLKHQKVGLRKEGVDPGVVGEGMVWWLERGGERYVPLEQGDWKRIMEGEAKL